MLWVFVSISSCFITNSCDNVNILYEFITYLDPGAPSATHFVSYLKVQYVSELIHVYWQTNHLRFKLGMFYLKMPCPRGRSLGFSAARIFQHKEKTFLLATARLRKLKLLTNYAIFYA